MHKTLRKAAFFLGGVGLSNLLIGAHSTAAANLLIGTVCLVAAALIAAVAYSDDDNQHKEE